MKSTTLKYAGREFDIHQFESLAEAQQRIGPKQILSLLNRGYHTRCRGKVQHAVARGDSGEAIQEMLDDYLPQDAPNRSEVALSKAIEQLRGSNLTPEDKARLRAQYGPEIVALMKD